MCGRLFVYQGVGMEKHIIYIVLKGGLVQEVRNLPAKSEVQVIDYDIEDELDPERIQISPLDGEACCISTFP